MRIITTFAVCLLLSQLFTACNKDEVLTSEARPEIVLEGDGSGIYSVKAGGQLTITPTYKNIDDATFSWVMDGEVVCTAPSWTATWPDSGEYYVVLSVANNAGSVSEELKIEVSALAPPVISLALPEDGLTLAVGSPMLLSPEYLYDDLEPFSVEWFVNGVSVSKEREYTFCETVPGDYAVRIVAGNADGTSTKEFNICVAENGDFGVRFSTPLFNSTSTERYTFAGRPVVLEPILHGFSEPAFEWSVDGVASNCASPQFRFTPETPGTYNVVLTVRQLGAEGRVMVASTTVDIVCVDAEESSRVRHATASSSVFSTTVFEYLPAPGQFIGEVEELYSASQEAANMWAQATLDKREYVSLGSFGGSLVVGFDHSVEAKGLEYDFAVEGNAFNSEAGCSNEPAVVWVMQDVNGNGMPDDEWYELRGSEYGKAGTIRNYAVTYYRPEAPQMSVKWTDELGNSGYIDYLASFHKQPYYYPSWVGPATYTLRGSRLEARNRHETGYWTNPNYDWGYADNVGSDAFKAKVDGKEGQFTGFKLANAIMSDGTPISLQYVDFVKVQSAVLAKSGPMGELSTEVFGIVDYSMMSHR